MKDEIFTHLIFRRATHADLSAILKLLVEDELGKTRESLSEIPEPCYEEAFQKIEADPSQALMVVEWKKKIRPLAELADGNAVPGASGAQQRSVYENTRAASTRATPQCTPAVELCKRSIIGTCHLTLIPSLTFRGATRLQVEAVRVAERLRGKKIGEWMFQKVFEYARDHQASIVQLTTNKLRTRAKKFYERIGFTARCEGMKVFF